VFFGVPPFAWAALVHEQGPPSVRTAAMYDRHILIEQTDPEIFAAIQA
jgi:hypothetical protein